MAENTAAAIASEFLPHTSPLRAQLAARIQAYAAQAAEAQVERLTERCEAYKGQVEAGQARIEATEARERALQEVIAQEVTPTGSRDGVIIYGCTWEGVQRIGKALTPPSPASPTDEGE